ncbi:hypothetical protein SSOG_01578 [Streptomyces himastatinicus ATCC 53653]|uniref:Uncharacterized protein n=1 Tax=Streptomyces himastatinicus ATCC 53653 TaxID=457427 RepID=D9WPK1_9ACTN|nr:hypothetical protein [Streptomyces himastatinicus]EFL21866.1 hypothetical protein SSOG_01578 [Streptomyces himastatinicus ATCC 53653]
MLDGGRLLALLAFEAAQDEFDLGGEATGGAVAVASSAGSVEDSAGVGERLLAGDHFAGHAAACFIS